MKIESSLLARFGEAIKAFRYNLKYQRAIDSGSGLVCPHCGVIDTGSFSPTEITLPCWSCFKKGRVV